MGILNLVTLYKVYFNYASEVTNDILHNKYVPVCANQSFIFPASIKIEFHGSVTFTPARRTSQRQLPRQRFMMCTSMRFPSVSPNNCQLNHMALAHMKLTPALTSSCPRPLPHVHTSMIDTSTWNIEFQRDFWNSVRPTCTSVPLCSLWAEGWVGALMEHAWYVSCTAFNDEPDSAKRH